MMDPTVHASEDERKRQILSLIRNRIWSHAVTVRVSKMVDNREDSWNTATGVFLELGDRRFVLTAWHVVERFDEIRSLGGLAVVVLGNVAIAEPKYVFLDERNDLIVLEVSEFAIPAFNAVPYRPTRAWPPPRLTVGDPVMICGFPAMFRSDEDEILHGDLTYFGEVESVSEHQFVVQIQGELEDAGRVPFPELNSDFGGVSGCPAFVLYSDHMQLAGIFSQSAVSAPVWVIRSIANLPANLAELAPMNSREDR
ncbi:MAG: trypsin-like peptidase domain-containing protein [Gemmatimonadaceae bacterium]|nr:trypsin-like peptidase domain-containing protein [Gemmatimonadaceae bacterium]